MYTHFFSFHRHFNHNCRPARAGMSNSTSPGFILLFLSKIVYARANVQIRLSCIWEQVVLQCRRYDVIESSQTTRPIHQFFNDHTRVHRSKTKHTVSFSMASAIKKPRDLYFPSGFPLLRPSFFATLLCIALHIYSYLNAIPFV